MYAQAAELIENLLGLLYAASQIYRLTNHYGAVLEADLDQPVVPSKPVVGVVYAQVDGAMLLTDTGYKENKLARLFAASSLRASVVEERGGHIETSLFTAHLGSAAKFAPKFKAHLKAHKALILDFYHALSHLGAVSQGAFSSSKQRASWLEI